MGAALRWHVNDAAVRRHCDWPGLDDAWLAAAGADGSLHWIDGGRDGASADERVALALDRATLVLRGRWLHTRNGRPQGLISRCLPARAGAADLEPAAIAALLARAGPHAARTWQRASVGTADAALAQRLQLAAGAPLLCLRQLRHAADGRPIESRDAVWCAESAHLLMELWR